MPEQTELLMRPQVGRIYSPGDGTLCEVKAVGPTHVVVGWTRGNGAHVIYTREKFEAAFREVPENVVTQPDLFGQAHT